MQKKIIITGGAGFIGRHISKLLLENNYEVHIIDTLVDEFTGKIVPDNILLRYFDQTFITNNIHGIDILEYEKILPHFKEAHAVIHLAAFISSPNSVQEPKKAFSTNIQGTLHVLEAARVSDCNNIIITSSCAVYGSIDGQKEEIDAVHPENPYGLSKYIDEQLALMYNDLYEMNITCVRYSNVWGPDQHDSGNYAPAIGRFINQVKNKSDITICGDGEQTRDFIHVHDVMRANLLLIQNMEKETVRGEVFNVCSGVESRIIDIAHIVKKIAQEKKYPYETAITHIAPRIEPRRFFGNNTKIRNTIPWYPQIVLDDGIQELL